MGKLVLVTGGSRSGKSRYAIELARGIGGRGAFLAPCEIKDDEMRERVALHQKFRPKEWQTIEEPLEVEEKLWEMKGKCDVLVLDCLTIYISNHLMAGVSQREIEEMVKGLIETAKSLDYTVIVVTNEVGSGIVPENPLVRRFRDLTGFANQAVALEADEVYFTVSGIPLRIKGREDEQAERNP